jgi:transposase InsO family protein
MLIGNANNTETENRREKRQISSGGKRVVTPAGKRHFGVPFASPNALFNLSKLSVWWLRLGIAIERIKPGYPQQNGRHERMQLTLKKEATRLPGFESLQQQDRYGVAPMCSGRTRRTLAVGRDSNPR